MGVTSPKPAWFVFCLFINHTCQTTHTHILQGQQVMRSTVRSPSLPLPQAPAPAPEPAPAAAPSAAASVFLPLCGPLLPTTPPSARQALVPSLDQGLSVLQALRAVVGDPSATFRDPHQVVCFSEAACTTKDLCIVMPTGACLGFCFQIP